MKVRVEVADTPYKLATGLMNRHTLAPDAGMLFVFPRSQVLNFWGESTFIPLDIAFVDHKGLIAKVSHIDRLSRRNVSSEVPCSFAVEVNSGFLEANGIHAGDRVVIEEDKYDGTILHFKKNAGNAQTDDEGQMKLAAWWNPADWFRNMGGRNPKQVTIPDGNKTPFTPQVDQPRDQGPQPDNSQDMSQPEQEDESGLPVVTPNDLQFADDDIDEDAAEEPVGYDEDGQPIYQTPDQQEGDEPTPDATKMTPIQAATEGIEKNLVMLITYKTVAKKRTIGPIRGGREIMREVEPHGVFHAKTTGNTVLVTWDRDMQGIRAFVIDRIVDKIFTGDHFDKKFVVKG
jgi:uncharacterized membrane protein (UPF0127 family)